MWTVSASTFKDKLLLSIVWPCLHMKLNSIHGRTLCQHIIRKRTGVAVSAGGGTVADINIPSPKYSMQMLSGWDTSQHTPVVFTVCHTQGQEWTRKLYWTQVQFFPQDSALP